LLAEAYKSIAMVTSSLPPPTGSRQLDWVSVTVLQDCRPAILSLILSPAVDFDDWLRFEADSTFYFLFFLFTTNIDCYFSVVRRRVDHPRFSQVNIFNSYYVSVSDDFDQMRVTTTIFTIYCNNSDIQGQGRADRWDGSFRRRMDHVRDHPQEPAGRWMTRWRPVGQRVIHSWLAGRRPLRGTLLHVWTTTSKLHDQSNMFGFFWC
jgi:hypothetical protein